MSAATDATDATAPRNISRPALLRMARQKQEALVRAREERDAFIIWAMSLNVVSMFQLALAMDLSKARISQIVSARSTP